MNIKFEYLYRDAGNFKNWGEVVFSNPSNLGITQIINFAKNAAIDEMFFEARKVLVPDLHFEDYDEDLDHGWHEIHTFIETEELPNDLQMRPIEKFINSLFESSKYERESLPRIVYEYCGVH